jgi:DNA-binding beta-propeller fold protein YncE
MLAYDLLRNRVLWVRHYTTGIDSMAITPNGRTIYMPHGEKAISTNPSTSWSVIDAATGAVTGSIQTGLGTHNAIMGPGGRYVYLGSVEYPYLDVVSTSTNRVLAGILTPSGTSPTTASHSRLMSASCI